MAYFLSIQSGRMFTLTSNTHLESVEPLQNYGVRRMDGLLLQGLPDNEPSSLEIHSSTIVCVTEPKNESVEMLERGVYAERGV
ncbi:hypothetical protein ColLi_02543 [Colletotrichum liriopes]|uniref:Uncharacterized protein n=1 Tax=Colletotrichum liriopes TaxID=708192 RepID=A0AA37LNY0_9PEZI|nr:hypothetical protein ColLi_02543 [Colletotrichum liriopes]